MKKTTGFLESQPGDKSSTRLFGAILLAYLMVFDWKLALAVGFIINYNFVLLNLVFLIAIFAPKYLQKIVESKFNYGGRSDYQSSRMYGPYENNQEQDNSRNHRDEDIDINAPA